MWWLAFCLTVMCLIEQRKLNNADDAVWFNIFSLSKSLRTVLRKNLPIVLPMKYSRWYRHTGLSD